MISSRERKESRSALVTGAGGFIGSHLVERLLADGWRVRALVRYHSSPGWGWLEELRERSLDGLEVVRGDITDPAQMREVVAGRRVVFHLAALISVPYSFRAPSTVFETNVMGTVNLAEAAREHRVRRFVLMSSSEVYGSALRVPIDEEHPLQAQSPYAASKIGGEKAVESYVRSFDLPAVTVRAFNTFGPRQSTRAIVPTIATQALTRDTIELGSLHPVRDLSYVEDTVAGLVAAAEAGDGAIGRVVNLGRGEGISVGDLAQMVGSLVGRPVEVRTDRERVRPEASEVDRLVSDNRLARELLGWQPRVGLEEGLERTIAWIRDHREHFPTLDYQV
jgi:NAD dependent epimerase/dehydratase